MAKKTGGSVGQKKTAKAIKKDSEDYRRDHEDVFIARDAMRRSKTARSVTTPPPYPDSVYYRLP